MYRYANPNPILKVTDDCVVRAVSIIMDIPWEKAYIDLCNRGLLIYDMPNQDATLSLYLREKGFKRYAISNNCPVCYTIADFAKEYPEGEYIVLTSGHAVPVIDGDYYDAVDSGRDIPMYYWKKER